ncbi:MAG: PQQ-binding-like beta-propeller repeat protein [Dehalococcoidia bacterium]|nr:PQQ-binding-like beta-propeller repeat protein [Dehalococcoidia bacterium]
MKAVRILSFVALVLVALSTTGCVGNAGPQGFAGISPDGDMLHVGSVDGRILVLDADARQNNRPFPSEGEWEYAITTESSGLGCSTTQVASTIYSAPLLVDGKVCVGTYEGKVFMLDGESRSQGLAFPQARAGEWVYPRDEDEEIGPIVGEPAVIGNTVYVTSSIEDDGATTGRVYALDLNFGDELWVSEALDGKLWATPAVHDGAIYVSTFDGHIFGLSGSTGEVLPWSYENPVGFVSSPFVAGGTVYAGAFDHVLYAVDLGAQQPKWTFEGGSWFWATPLLVGNTLLAPCLDGKLYAIDASTGKPVWNNVFDAVDGIATSPVLVGDSVVVATMEGDVYFVNIATAVGTRVPNVVDEKRPTCDAKVVASPVYFEGMVYVRAQDNVLYGIDPATEQVKFTFSLDME